MPQAGRIYSPVFGRIHVDLRKQVGFSRRYRCFYWDAALTPETARDRESGWQLGWKVALRSGGGYCKEEFLVAKETHNQWNNENNCYWLVVWLPFLNFPINIGNLIIPIDFHIFQRGGLTTNQVTISNQWTLMSTENTVTISAFLGLQQLSL